MASVRYIGSSPWDRTLTDDDGKFKGTKTYRFGDVIDDLSEEDVEALAGRDEMRDPRHLRTFVRVGSVNDAESDDYVPGPYEAVTGNASAYPKLDMGSTVTGDGRPQFLLPADGGTDRGTPSDNAALIEVDEQEAAAAEARAKVIERQGAAKRGNSASGSRSVSQATIKDKEENK